MGNVGIKQTLMDKKRISVVIPTYKPGAYIWECLDSLGRQTLSKEEFEVIIVLNGEKEPYFSQIEDYVRQHEGELNMRLLYSEKSGVSNARNIGIEEAKGEYLTFVDDDDWMSESYLADMLKLADKKSFVATNIFSIEEGTGQQLDFYITDAYQRMANEGILSIFKGRSFTSAVWGKLVPREAVGNIRFPIDFKLGEDSIFMFEVSKNLDSIRLTPPEAVYYYRDQGKSATHKPFSYSFRVKQALRVMARFTSLYLKSPLSYNFPYFLSRIIAQLLKLTYKTYH